MNKNDWKTVLSRLEIQGGPIKPVNKAILKQYENKIGMTLPSSYRDYCCIVGPGEITVPHCYRICVPKASHRAFNIERLNTEIKGMAGIDLMSPDPLQFRRGIYFGTDIATSDYFWDPEDVTDEAKGEFGIYVRYRNWQVDRLCDTFWDFINDICLSKGNPTQDNTLGLELVFSP